MVFSIEIYLSVEIYRHNFYVVLLKMQVFHILEQLARNCHPVF